MGGNREGTPIGEVPEDFLIGMLRVQLAEVCPWGLGQPNIFSLTVEELQNRPDLYEGHEPCICHDRVGMYSRAFTTIENMGNQFAAHEHVILNPEDQENTYYVEEDLPGWTHRSVFVMLGNG